MEAVLTELVTPEGYGNWFPDSRDVASPAAGANASVAVPGGEAWRLVAATAQLDTSASAANRLLSLDFIVPRTAAAVRNAAPVLVTASTTAQAFAWQRNRGESEWNTGTPIFVPLLSWWLLQTWTIQWTVDSIQAADQLSNLHVYFDRCVMPGYDVDAA